MGGRCKDTVSRSPGGTSARVSWQGRPDAVSAGDVLFNLQTYSQALGLCHEVYLSFDIHVFFKQQAEIMMIIVDEVTYEGPPSSLCDVFCVFLEVIVTRWGKSNMMLSNFSGFEHCW